MSVYDNHCDLYELCLYLTLNGQVSSYEGELVGGGMGEGGGVTTSFL